MPTRPLSVLLPLLAAGCHIRSSCGDFKGGTFQNEATFGVSQEELSAAVDDDGELTESGCADLCRARHWFADAIVSIDTCGPADAGVPATPTPTTDTGGEPALVVQCTWTENAICEGRAHAAVTSRPEGVGPDALAAWLARAAHAEASSVKAFVSLALELERLGAPTALVDRARSAARDEVKHARMLGRLAGSRGGLPRRPTFTTTPERSLVALAVENAVEGCVHETWAAMVAHHQAVHASDPEIRSAFATIAEDEARHGELAFAIDAWLAGRLTPAERSTVAAARASAIAGLIDGLVEPLASVARAAGLPGADRSLSLASAIVREVWAT